MKTKTLYTLLVILLPFLLAAQIRGTGSRFDLKMYGKAETADFSGLGFTTTLPASVSYKLYAPYPKDQGQTSTCVGWSTTYAALTIENAKMLGLQDKNKITAKAFCPYFTYNQMKSPDDFSCQVGTYIYTALTALRNSGGKRFYLPIYECGTTIDEEAISRSKPFRIKSFKKLFDYPTDMEWSNEKFFQMDVDKVAPVKQALANGHVVPFGMQVIESMFQLMGTDLWEPTAAELAAIPNITTYGHAMCVIGYDDNKYGGAFEVMNSWGTEWGNGGFFWIKYSDFKKFVVDAYYFELFNEVPATATGCVSGDCKDSYSRMTFASGDEYEGGFKNGTYDGYGIYVWNDGYVYAGQWKNGKRDGLGTSIAPNSSPYTESWADDAPSYTTQGGSTGTGCKSGNCDNGFGTYQYEDGTYTGTFTDSRRNGFGTYTYSTGVKVICTWLNDQVDGFGKIQYTDGYNYIGEFMLDMQNGYGLEYGYGGFVAGEWLFGEFITPDDGLGFAGKSALKESNSGIGKLKPAGAAAGAGCISGDCNSGYGYMKYDNGDSYEGYFKNGYREGYGNYAWANGTKHEGTWIADKMDGMGEILFPNGAYFIGEFRKGLQDGYGIEIGADGYTAGIWEFGTFKPGQTSLGFTQMKEKGFKEINIGKTMGNSPASEKVVKAVASKKVSR